MKARLEVQFDWRLWAFGFEVGFSGDPWWLAVGIGPLVVALVRVL